MEKFRVADCVITRRGQSLVEYLLLLVVITSITIAFVKNKKIKDFMGGKGGYFATLREGMAYSYRYGREYNSSVDFDAAASFNYQNNNHHTYLHSSNMTRFFSSKESYGE